MWTFIFLGCIATWVTAVPFSNTADCEKKTCHPTDPKALNIHLISHSHDDVGWLKTVDQYYYGTNNSIQLAGVQYILDSVVEALQENPERRFIQVESAFLYQWLNDSSEDMTKAFKDLVSNGQIEIVGGAWSMNDEAATNYQSIIDQFTLGLKFLKDTFGKCGTPRMAWQIDPFGHSKEMASIFAQLGYDAFFVVRVDYRDKAKRLETKTAELVWEGSANLGESSRIFTHIMYDHYRAPNGFNFDILNKDDPIVTNKNSLEYNLDAKIKSFKDHVIKQSGNYSTNHVLILMGEDFAYQDAHYNYANIDALIKAFEDNPQYDAEKRRIKLIYSTPGCYAAAVNEYAKTNKLKFMLKTDDFMPYASDKHSYWSGFYTSRPTQKRFERIGNNFLQIGRQLASMLKHHTFNELERIMAVMQHHDAITGTEKQHVAKDYARMWSKAMDTTQKNIGSYILPLLKKGEEIPKLSFSSCLLSNVSHCETSVEKEKFVIAVYNPLSRPVSYNVRLPVPLNNFEVKGLDESEVPSQLVPSIDGFSYVKNINPGKYDLVFNASNVPALGFKVYYITKKEVLPEVTPIPEADSIGTAGQLQVTLNKETGFITGATYKGVTIDLEQKLMYYEGSTSGRSSGAYIFRPAPNSTEAKPFGDKLKEFKIFKGDVVDELHQTFSDSAKQIVRIYKNGENHIEFDWLAGPIDVSDGIGKEIISRFTTTLDTGDVFKTDSNGRELLKRQRNTRSSYTLTQEELVAQNYYPVTSFITIEDSKKHLEFAVLNDRAQGGSSLKSGEIELMLHRRLLKDDGFGVSQALNETEFGQGLVVRGQHYVTFGSTEDGFSRKQKREIAQRKLHSPWVFIADATSEDNSLEKLKNLLQFEISALKAPLPEEVQLLTLQPWTEANLLLIRLENIFDKAKDESAINVDLEDKFHHFKIVSLNETTLGANQLVEENHPWEWDLDDCLESLEPCPLSVNPKRIPTNKFVDMKNIALSPMQIRTFIASIERNVV